MINHSTIDEITDKLTAAMPESLRQMQADVEKNIRAILSSSFAHMNLIEREEFDIQSALLEKLQQRLSELEARITELETHQP